MTPVTRRGGPTLCPAPWGRDVWSCRGCAWRASPGSWAGAEGSLAQVSTQHRPRRNSSTCSSDPNSHVSASAGFCRPLSHPDANTQRNSFKDAKLNKPLGGSSQENRQQVKSCLYLQSVRTPSLTSRPPHTHAESSSVNSTIRIGLKIKISFCRYVIRSLSLPRGDRASGVSAAPGEVPGPAQRRGLQLRLEGIHGGSVL